MDKTYEGLKAIDPVPPNVKKEFCDLTKYRKATIFLFSLLDQVHNLEYLFQVTRSTT